MSAALKGAKENRDMLNDVIEAVDKLTRMQAKATKQTEKATEATIKFTKSSSSFNKEMEEGTNNFDRRTQAINRAIKKMEGMGKQFELLNYQSLQAFRKEQGNIFEYLDMLLTSTKEQVKILGIEAGTARRVLYGFFPPGMFSLVSKLSTGMKFLGAVTRQFSDSTDEAGKKQKNLFTTIGKGMGFLTKFRKRAITAKEATEEMSTVIEKSSTVSDMTKAEGAIQQQIEAEKSVSVFGGLFGENTHIDEKDRRTKGHKLATQGIGDTEETISTVLSASPEALYKNMELASRGLRPPRPF